ncbi:hypothetical protein KC19_10G051100 [Ceratodon purpureus]|uniref:Protein kinase domain-containing protein n=1 Tax=Ceratodon purpureus TaxID=3225 RepID=A0A8T0GKN4_CERPU|nr:hypothetical protein KC19_10G051100 [Ceratodon purpureus]
MGNVSCIKRMEKSTSIDPAPHSSTPSPYISPRIESMRENGSDFTERTSSEITEQSKVHWSEVDRAADSDEEYDPESDRVYFDEVLKKHPEWKHFFRDFPNLEVHHKMTEGGQGAIYYAQRRGYPYRPVVVKVLKEGYPLRSLLQQIPSSVLSAKDKDGSPLENILGATMLNDEKLKNRFALVFEMLICDLRKFIDDRKLRQNPDGPPFTIGVITRFMHKIAKDMECLHDEYGIIHKDLKASNVLFCVNPMKMLADRFAGLSVADFECSMSVVGTGFWRAPEVLRQLKDGRSSAQVEFTRASDVYSFGMVGYELVTGLLPFEGYSLNDYDVVLTGQRPELPEDLHYAIRHIITDCWHPEPSMRPTFGELTQELGMLLNDPIVRAEQLMPTDHPLFDEDCIYYQRWTYDMGKKGHITGHPPLETDDSV